MTHEQLTDAVRASANLSSSSAERRGTYPKRNLVPGGLRLPSEKHCPTCGTTKVADEFGANRAKSDGLQTQCRPCRYTAQRRRDAERRRTDPEFRERERLASQKGRSPENTAQRRATIIAERRTVGTREWARKQVHLAVMAGRMAKPSTCSLCGATPPKHQIHGHHWHEDYSNRPLEVEWLCTLCHGAAHVSKVVPGELRMPDASAFEPTRDHASRATNAGHDGGSAAPSITTTTRCQHGTPRDVTCPECVLDSWDTAPASILPGPEQPSMDEEAGDEWLGWDWHYPRWD